MNKKLRKTAKKEVQRKGRENKKVKILSSQKSKNKNNKPEKLSFSKEEKYSKNFHNKVKLYSKLMSSSIILFIVSLAAYNYFVYAMPEIFFLSVLFFSLFLIGIVSMVVFIGLIMYYSFWKV
jgi:hypothetical protein